jgi:hypothetical protein
MSTDPRLLELLDAELDGQLDAAAASELSARLAADPEARAARAELQRLHAALSGLPEQPLPDSLHAAILRALPPPAQVDTNLSGAGRYVLAWPRRMARAMRFPHSPSTSHHTSRSTMNRSKILAVGALAVAIGAVLFFGLREPSPPASDAVGTIAPATRYQAPTVGEPDVQLGDEGTAKFLQSDAFRLIQADAKLAAALSSDAFRQALASDAFRQALASDSFRQALASDAFRQALASDSFRQALASDSFRQALRSDSFRQALASDSFRQAMKLDAQKLDSQAVAH